MVQGTRKRRFGTGAGRVFRSTDRGRHWTVDQTPIRAGNGRAGIFSLAFWDADHGVAVGGDYKEPERPGAKSACLTSDGGRTWRCPRGSQPAGYRSAVTRLPDSPDQPPRRRPTGTHRSADAGESWTKLTRRGLPCRRIRHGPRRAGRSASAGDIARETSTHKLIRRRRRGRMRRVQYHATSSDRHLIKSRLPAVCQRLRRISNG